LRDRSRTVERLCFGVGATLIAVWAAAQVHREVGHRQDLEAFEAAQRAMVEVRQLRLAQAAPVSALPDVAATIAPAGEPDEVPTLPVAPDAASGGDTDELPPLAVPDAMVYDYSLWSPRRVEDYEASLSVDMSAPRALLQIPRFELKVPVLEGIDELTLNRAVGRIPGTARPGGLGNIGIAGHRDGFFRVLKDIKVGDDIELVTWREKFRYRVVEIDIVEKHDVNVLTASDDSMVTLVTCYPFYFVGHAPKRYIVKASLADSEII